MAKPGRRAQRRTDDATGEDLGALRRRRPIETTATGSRRPRATAASLMAASCEVLLRRAEEGLAEADRLHGRSCCRPSARRKTRAAASVLAELASSPPTARRPCATARRTLDGARGSVREVVDLRRRRGEEDISMKSARSPSFAPQRENQAISTTRHRRLERMERRSATLATFRSTSSDCAASLRRRARRRRSAMSRGAPRDAVDGLADAGRGPALLRASRP